MSKKRLISYIITAGSALFLLYCLVVGLSQPLSFYGSENTRPYTTSIKNQRGNWLFEKKENITKKDTVYSATTESRKVYILSEVERDSLDTYREEKNKVVYDTLVSDRDNAKLSFFYSTLNKKHTLAIEIHSTDAIPKNTPSFVLKNSKEEILDLNVTHEEDLSSSQIFTSNNQSIIEKVIKDTILRIQVPSRSAQEIKVLEFSLKEIYWPPTKKNNSFYFYFLSL